MYYCIIIEYSSTDVEAGRGMLRWLWGTRGSVVRAPAAKAGGPGFDSQQLPWFFFLFQLAYTNADGVKDLWCSSTVWLLSTQT